MERVSTIIYKGKSIILVDLSSLPPEETLKVLPQAKAVIAKCPPKSALILTDVTNAVYNKEVASAIKEFSTHNTPYVKHSAVVGASGLSQVLLQTVIFLTRRELKAFSTRDQAKAWLVAL